MGLKAYRQERGWQHIVLTASAEAVVDYVNAGFILCADTIASSVELMPPGQQVHQSTGFSPLRAVVAMAPARGISINAAAAVLCDT